VKLRPAATSTARLRNADPERWLMSWEANTTLTVASPANGIASHQSIEILVGSRAHQVPTEANHDPSIARLVQLTLKELQSQGRLFRQRNDSATQPSSRRNTLQTHQAVHSGLKRSHRAHSVAANTLLMMSTRPGHPARLSRQVPLTPCTKFKQEHHQ
jgi:hypothetical protein